MLWVIRKCSKKRISRAPKSLFIVPIRYVTSKSKDSVFPEQGYELSWVIIITCVISALTAVGAPRALIDFTLSNARRLHYAVY